MKRQWDLMGYFITPKAHLIFEHTADNQQRFGRLGDKVEDSIERMHKKQVTQNYRTMRMKGVLEQN